MASLTYWSTMQRLLEISISTLFPHLLYLYQMIHPRLHILPRFVILELPHQASRHFRTHFGKLVQWKTGRRPSEQTAPLYIILQLHFWSYCTKGILGDEDLRMGRRHQFHILVLVTQHLQSRCHPQISQRHLGSQYPSARVIPDHHITHPK